MFEIPNSKLTKIKEKSL